MVNSLMSAARIIHSIHWIFLMFVVAAWILPWPAAWIAHLLVLPLLFLHWRTNNNRCILTEIEERLRAGTTSATTLTKTDSKIAANTEVKSEAEDGQFIKSVIARLTGVTLSAEGLARLIYVVMAIVWLISLIRTTEFVSGLRAF